MCDAPSINEAARHAGWTAKLLLQRFRMLAAEHFRFDDG